MVVIRSCNKCAHIDGYRSGKRSVVSSLTRSGRSWSRWPRVMCGGGLRLRTEACCMANFACCRMCCCCCCGRGVVAGHLSSHDGCNEVLHFWLLLHLHKHDGVGCPACRCSPTLWSAACTPTRSREPSTARPAFRWQHRRGCMQLPTHRRPVDPRTLQRNKGGTHLGNPRLCGAVRCRAANQPQPGTSCNRKQHQLCHICTTYTGCAHRRRQQLHHTGGRRRASTGWTPCQPAWRGDGPCTLAHGRARGTLVLTHRSVFVPFFHPCV